MTPPRGTNLSVQPGSVDAYLESTPTEPVRSATASDMPDLDVTDRSPQDKRKRTRAWSQITGITLHQTGVHRFPAKAWPRVTCHLGVHADGSVYWVHPLQALLWASNGFNSSTIAIEVAGNYRREEGRPNSFWSTGGGPSTLTDVIIAGIRKAIRFAIAEVARNGGRINFVHAHRQASKGRPACPGEAIWRAGGVWAQTELGLSDGGDGYTIGDGLAIPTAWDDRRGHVGKRGLDEAALERSDLAEHSAEIDVEFPDAGELAEVVRQARGAALLQVPAGLEVRRVLLPGRGERTLRGPLPGLPHADDMIGEALAREGLELVEELALVAVGDGPDVVPLRRGPPREPDALRLALPVDPDERAVILLEQDGVHRWLWPRHIDGEAQFELSVDAPDPGAPLRRGAGWLGDLRIRVFRFLARHGLAALEQRRRSGLVHLAGPFIADWRPIAARPLAGAAPVLLLLHGAFSSTLGCFGALAQGDTRFVLERALQAGHLVLGHDHPTLSQSPDDNAAQIFADLAAADLLTREIRIVCHSRGGLVARCLARRISEHRGRPVELVLGVATTDNGTLLAAPAQWGRLVDVITNLAALAGAAGALLGGGAIAGTLVHAAISGLADLVQALADETLDPHSVPGLAAMTAGGPFLAGLPAWSPAIVADRRVLVSDFSASGQQRGLAAAARKAALWALDDIADRFFALAPNDIVVEHASTRHQLDAAHVDELPVGDRVHHLGFFAAPAVGLWLAQHLQLPVARITSTPSITRGPPPDRITRGLPGVHEALAGTDAAGGTDLYMQANLPAAVRPREPFWVALDLAREPDADAVPPQLRGDIDPEQLIDLELVALENAVVGPAARASVKAPQPGARVRVSLDAEATVAGTARLRAVATQAGRVVMAIDLSLASSPTTTLPTTTVLHTEARERTLPAHQLAIYELRDGSGLRLRFNFTSPANEVSAQFESPRIDGDLCTFVTRLYDQLEGGWDQAHRDPDKFERTLRALGGLLLRQLVPPQLATLLWTHRNTLAGLQLLSDEIFVPWELVYLSDPDDPRGGCFLAELGLVRGLWGATFSPRISVRKALVVVPDYPSSHALPAAPGERSMLAALLRASAHTPTTAESVMQLLEQPGRFDLLHFICHGDVSETTSELLLGAADASSAWRRDDLSANSVEQDARLRGPGGERPLVFINACKVGRGQRLLTSMGGWAPALLTRGAGALVAPLWSVGDQSARHFAEAFYRSLLAGQTFAEAAAAARARARERGDPTWLAYAVYAAPDGELALA